MTKILIVDDEPAIRRVLERFLEEKGYETLSAGDGKETLDQIAKASPSIVLLDIDMPGKSGIEVLQEIKQRYPHIAVIMVTGLTDEETGRTALERGAFDYITKPFDLEYLEKVVWWKIKTMEDTQG